MNKSKNKWLHEPAYALSLSRGRESESCSVVSDSLQPHGLYSPRNSPFSRGSSQPRDWTQISLIPGRFFTSWAPREAQEYWSGEPILSPADLLNPGIKPGSPALQVDSLPTELSGKPKYHPLSYSIITLNKIYKTMVLRHWIIGRTVILREWKQRKWVLPMSQLTIWREFPGYHTHGTPEE